MLGRRRADAVARTAQPRFAGVPSGLPDIWANDFFTNALGTRSTAIDATTTRDQMKTLIRTSGPLAIFTRSPGHLKLVVGFWDGGASDPQSPQIIMFNPESYILAAERSGDYGRATLGSLREERHLWGHWKAYYASNLVGAKCWHY